MSRFAEYRPSRPSGAEPIEDLRVEVAREGDVPAIGSLLAEREGGRAEDHADAIRKQLADSPDTVLFVARSGGSLPGFGRVGRLDIEGIPAGWYLTGVVVSEAHRRRGVGRALTVHRIRWLAARTDTIRYFANPRNRASIRLHSELGFREVRRGVRVPGVVFEGGEGVLYRLRITRETGGARR